MGHWSSHLPRDEVHRISERATDRAVARFAIRHMNDTKWREVLTLLNSPGCPIRCIKLKFVDTEHIVESSGGFRILNESWCDGFPGPFSFREIEWMDIPRTYRVQRGNRGTPPSEHQQDVAAFRTALVGLGQLPIREQDDGIRIVAYE
jgi:hypothetical protein